MRDITHEEAMREAEAHSRAEARTRGLGIEELQKLNRELDDNVERVKKFHKFALKAASELGILQKDSDSMYASRDYSLLGFKGFDIKASDGYPGEMVEITYQGQVVFKTSDKNTRFAQPFPRVEVYTPGEWEVKFARLASSKVVENALAKMKAEEKREAAREERKRGQYKLADKPRDEAHQKLKLLGPYART